MPRLIIVLFAAFTALGAASSASGTVRAARAFDTAPDPQTLLAQAGTATIAANTVHFSVAIDLATPLVNVTAQSEGDLIFKPQALRAVQSFSVNKGQLKTESVIQIKKKAWHKSQDTHNRWGRGRGSISLVDFTPKNDPFGVKKNAKGKGVVGVKYETVGAETLNGVAVWRVRQTVTEKSSKGHAFDSAFDFLIGQTDSLVYQASATMNDPDDYTSVSETLTYSGWGAPVSIKAPKVGSKMP